VRVRVGADLSAATSCASRKLPFSPFAIEADDPSMKVCWIVLEFAPFRITSFNRASPIVGTSGSF
jgi:hypothetical protein